MDAYLFFAVGVALAVLGGEYFVRGIVGLAKRRRLPASMVAGILAGAATSAPELAVSTMAAWNGMPEIGLGDALGSNVVNLGLVLGLVVSLAGMSADRRESLRDLFFLLAVPAATVLLVVDGDISRIDALALLCLFAAWLIAKLRAGREHQSRLGEDVGSHDNSAQVTLQIALGLGILIGSGRLIVTAAQDILVIWNLSGYIFGATVVALGTSVPELATAVVARLRGNQEVGLATLLGSNIFNGSFIVSVAALIHPITVEPAEVAVALAAGVFLVILSIPRAGRVLSRGRGALLVATYAGYVLALVAW